MKKRRLKWTYYIYIQLFLLLGITGMFCKPAEAQTINDLAVQTVSEAVQDLDGDGIMDNLNATVAMAGRASVDNWIFNDQALSFFLQDQKRGIQAFSGTLKTDVKAGDSVVVIGKLQLYYDKPEIIADSVIVIESKLKPPAPKALSHVMENPEQYLGMITEGQATIAQASSNGGSRGIMLAPSDTSTEFIEVYISQSNAFRSDFRLHKLRVGDKVKITGIVGKFTYDNKEKVVYQILPRSPNDVQVLGFPQYYTDIFFWVTGIVIILIIGWVVTLRRRVKAQTEELSNALKEKEVLMQEIHHRVKNNLAKISALLDLQISTADHPAVEESLSNSKSRINSMALVHDKLYQTQTYKSVRLDSYLKELITAIHETMHAEQGNVELAFDLDPVEISVDKVVVCGLLVNELIVNAYKYAFNAQQEGELKVSLINTSGTIELSISDNGPGLPDDFESLVGHGLGSILIKNFSEQLEAIMDVRSGEEGAIFTFKFEASV